GDEDAAEHGAEGDRDPRDRRPDAEGARPLRVLGVHVPDERERAGLAGRGADAHHDARGDQVPRARRERAEERPAREERDAGEHHPLPSKQVAERPAGQHQRREREHVSVDDPLQRRHSRAERRLHVGKRDADDGVVEEREEEHRGHRRECVAAVHLTGCEAALYAAWLAGPARAVTTATSAWPASAPVTRYESLVAPSTGLHTRPFGLHRRHSYEIRSGSGRQLPGPAVRVAPGCGEPERPGAAAATSAAPAAAIGPARFEYAAAVPVESVARTASPSVLPASARTVRYVDVVAPWIDAQCDPAASHRYHWYAYASGPTPDQTPADPASRAPTAASPAICGGAER